VPFHVLFSSLDVTAVLFVAAISEYDQVSLFFCPFDKKTRALTAERGVAVLPASFSRVFPHSRLLMLYVAVVVFVCCQMLNEDENTNRIVEALNLFEEICNSRWFRETSMILFLNKRDLFADKIQTVPLELYFPEYKGGGDVESARAFMQEQFESKNRNPDKQIYTHLTCATDTHNIAAVFNAVKDIIIRKSLNEAGLV
jgi:hypothetical protein